MPGSSVNGVGHDDIRVIREPMVSLVGRPVVAPEAIDQLLNEHGVSWQS